MIKANIENNLDIKEIKADLTKEYKELIDDYKKEEKSSDIYFYIQIFLALILIVASFYIKGSNEATFSLAKNTYTEFFEKETVLESNFSYNVFLDNIKEEIRVAFDRLNIAYEEVFARGSGVPSNVSYDKYNLNIDIKSPLDGYITSSFGSRSDPFGSNTTDFHTGLDIAAAKGTFIKAAADGVVIEAEYSPIAGNYIVVQTNEELTLMYGHTQFMLVKKGDKILQGQVIATVGETGLATGPHLHFEVRIDGVRYNPIYAISE